MTGEMKEKLKKYLPPSCRNHILDQLNKNCHGSKSIQDYMVKFDNLTLRGDVREDPRQTLSRFLWGLKPKIRQAMLANSYHVNSLLDAFKLTQDLEISFIVLSERKFPPP